MTWRFRRSLKLGPLKLNFSKSGVGYSVGVRGFRVGKDAKCRSYTAASIPGTGLYNRTYGSGSSASPDAMSSPAGAAPQQRAGIGLALVVAFIAGGLVVLFLTALFSSPSVYPPVTPPAAVSVPVAPPQPVPAKRTRGHRSKRVAAPAAPQPSAGERNQTRPNMQSPAN